jgi:hypothetical protein
LTKDFKNIKFIKINLKPMSKRSRYWKVFRELLAGANAVYRNLLNGLARAARNQKRE